MREIRPSGSEGGEAGNLTGLPYPYHDTHSVGAAVILPPAKLQQEQEWQCNCTPTCRQP